MPKRVESGGHRESSRARRVVAAGAILSMALTVSAYGNTKNPSTVGKIPPAVHGPVHGTTNGPQHAEAQLDCTETLTYDDQRHLTVSYGSPREIRYFGGKEPRVWAALTTVTVGQIVKNPGKAPEDDTQLFHTWAIQSYDTNPDNIRYAVGQGLHLPPNWDRLPAGPDGIKYVRKDYYSDIKDKEEQRQAFAHGYVMQSLINTYNIVDTVDTTQAPYVTMVTSGDKRDVTQYDMITIFCNDGAPVEGAVKPIPVDPQTFQYVN